jgi:hypothetical protein
MILHLPVLASAIVDPSPRGWAVTVWGQAPHAEQRVYEIKARSDALAAQEGIERFVREMERLHA